MKMKMKIMGTHIFGWNIISKTNPFPVMIAYSYSSVDHYWPSLFPRRYGKARKDQEAEDDDGGEKGTDQTSKTQADRARAPSTAEEFNRVAAEKEAAAQTQSAGKESETLGNSAASNEDLDKGPGYRPCS